VLLILLDGNTVKVECVNGRGCLKIGNRVFLSFM
jgi:hypothetical protein